VRLGAGPADVEELAQAVGIRFGHFREDDDRAFESLERVDCCAGDGATRAGVCPGERVGGQFLAFVPFGPCLGSGGENCDRSGGHVLLVQEFPDGVFDSGAFLLIVGDLDLDGISAFRPDGRASGVAAVRLHDLGVNLLGITTVLAQEERLFLNGEVKAGGINVLVIVVEYVEGTCRRVLEKFLDADPPESLEERTGRPGPGCKGS